VGSALPLPARHDGRHKAGECGVYEQAGRLQADGFADVFTNHDQGSSALAGMPLDTAAPGKGGKTFTCKMGA
jgi:hypothetical protein